MARKMRPEVILMDVNMPVMDGIEATRKITAELLRVRVIGISMNKAWTVKEEMKDAGATAYIQKSEVLDLLVETLRSEASVY